MQIKKILVVVSLFAFPFVAVAAEQAQYTGLFGGLEMIGDKLDTFWNWIGSDVPSIFTRAWAWFKVWWLKVKMYMWLETLKFNWTIAKVLIEDLTLGSQIATAISGLPQDVKQAGIDSGIFDAINLLLQAFITRFAMRTF